MENKKLLQEQYTELIRKLNTMAEEHILEGKYTHEELIALSEEADRLLIALYGAIYLP
ncbi:MAG: hypothetical protein J6D00_09430 [Christensenellaceae bacterium]|nr:hypothetical protein [Christensenellaceae bacterium]MBR3843266.1 hypothetical protein [Christensenellaceae bacterium]